MLFAKGIDVQIGGMKILDGIDLTLASGEIVSLLGPNGGGKSTMLKVLSLLLKPTSGEVWHEDNTGEKRIPKWPDVTIVSQNFLLWPHLNVENNLLLAPKQLGRFDEKQYSELLDFFQLNDLLKRHPHQISGGQRQRVALVRAMLLKPKFLLLDEITSALDQEQVQNLSQKLLRLKEEGTGIMMVTHQLSFAESISDRLVTMEKGRIVG